MGGTQREREREGEEEGGICTLVYLLTSMLLYREPRLDGPSCQDSIIPRTLLDHHIPLYIRYRLHLPV